MSVIKKTEFPQFYRLEGLMIQGMGRMVSNEKDLCDFLFSFFVKSEYAELLSEMKKIQAMKLTEEQWARVWFDGPAFAIPSSGKDSEAYLNILIEGLEQRLGEQSSGDGSGAA